MNSAISIMSVHLETVPTDDLDEMDYEAGFDGGDIVRSGGNTSATTAATIDRADRVSASAEVPERQIGGHSGSEVQ